MPTGPGFEFSEVLRVGAQLEIGDWGDCARPPLCKVNVAADFEASWSCTKVDRFSLNAMNMVHVKHRADLGRGSRHELFTVRVRQPLYKATSSEYYVALAS